MTEIVAAHLERVAKEWYATFKERDPHHCEGYEETGDDCFVMHQPYTFEIFRNAPLVLAGLDAVAAALAACAREEQLGEAKRIYTNWNVADRDFEKWLKAHIAALERAVGEKTLPTVEAVDLKGENT